MKEELTVEQSKRLIELGVDPKMASIDRYDVERQFTLTDLFSILSKQLPHTLPNRMEIRYPFTQHSDVFVRYAKFVDEPVVAEFSAPELIDALYELTIFCIEYKLMDL